jgi:ATP-dependent helicase/nuclease subunit B
MVVLSEAIEVARRSDEVDLLSAAVHWPGYRRQLLGRFDSWTHAERPPEAPPTGDSPVEAEEWAMFRHYRATLRELGAEDSAGWSVWASRALVRQPPPELRKLGHVVAIDPTSLTRASWRLLDLCHQTARSMTVTLPFDRDPSLAELYASIEPTRRQFLGWGFVEEPDRPDGFSFRPHGPDAVERELFRSDAHERPRFRLGVDHGLKVLGGPRGEGLGLLVAREVRGQLDRGVPPEEILVLVPRLDEDAERIREALGAWNLPVDRAVARRLSTVAAVSALRMAMRLPVDGWLVSAVVRLLRSGQVRWPGLDQASKFGRFEAASAIRSTRVFRDRDALRRTLERAATEDPSRDRSSGLALQAIDRLSGILDSTVGAGPWSLQVDRARRIADGLGLEPIELEPLWDALDDQGWVRGGLGPAIAEESLTWAQFVAHVENTVAEIEVPPRSCETGTIRIEVAGAAAGARARVVILANLAEKTFPDPEAVDLGSVMIPDPGTAGGPNPAYSREMLRFAGIAGSSDEQLVLAFPTTDVNGEPLLPSGFLDDLIRRLDDRSAALCVEKHARFDPVLMAHPDLARSAADARVRAVALACQSDDFETLRGLSAEPHHAEALRGTANAFEVAHRRRVDQAFGPYDGRLVDPKAIAAIRQEFGPDHAFSPSQLESFALCPFQFYQRYVLGLKVVDERRELDEDYAGRGSEVHRVLEQIHQQADAEAAENLIDRLNVLIETEMRVELAKHDEAGSDLPEVLKEIGARRTNKTLGRYIGQFRSYYDRPGVESRPHRFEVAFGQEPEEGEEPSHPHLTIGTGEESVRLQGKIDRIDLVRKDGQVMFRVIDYKTGSNPAGKDVRDGLASQLPLYALAVERLVFPEGNHTFHDAGYWSLPKDGFKSVKLDDWGAYRDRLMAFVLDLVAELRGGMFPIESRKKDCRKSCDYQGVCRVVEVRMVGKSWPDRPSLGEEG